MLKNLAIALSLANLCFLQVWAELFDPAYRFYAKDPPSAVNIAAAFLNISVLSFLVWGALHLSNSARTKTVQILGRLGLVFTLVVALNAMYFETLKMAGPFERQGIFYFVFVMVILLSILTSPMRFLGIGQGLALLLFPFVLVTLGHAIWILLAPGSGSSLADKPPAVTLPLPPEPRPRVLWMVFDELDQRLVFSERPATIRLPELDRFKAQAVYANHGYPPGDRTLRSLPAFTTGKRISRVNPVGVDELILTLAEGGEEIPWSTMPNIFTEAYDGGFNTALVGAYFPSCRIIGESLTTCSWHATGFWNYSSGTLSANVLHQVMVLAHTIPIVGPLYFEYDAWSGTAGRSKSQEAYQQVLQRALRTSTDPRLGLVLIHWPVPHPPGIYDRVTDSLALAGNYLDNLELVDRALGEIRTAMEDAGLWDKSVVLVTSDHWWRTNEWSGMAGWTEEEEAISGDKEADHRVPFMLKMPGQKETLDYTEVFNTVLTHDLLLAILREEISTPREVADWLDQHRSVGETPY